MANSIPSRSIPSWRSRAGAKPALRNPNPRDGLVLRDRVEGNTMELERYIISYDPTTFGFACCACIRQEDGSWRRCGEKTWSILVIGANQVTIPYCDKHMKEHM